MGAFLVCGILRAVNRSVTGRLLAVAGAVLLGGLVLVTPPAARAADSGLRLVTSTRYTAVPAERRVAVSVDGVATNLTPDPPDSHYYYTSVRFAVQPGIANLSASSGGQVLASRIVSTAAEYTEVQVTFGRAIFHEQSMSFRVNFDITDPGGAARRDVRIAPSLVAFPVWAFGSEGTPGSSVSVVIPPGYTVTVEAGDLTSSASAGGATLLTSRAVSDPYSFFAYVTAERPGAFTSTTASVSLPQGTISVLVRAWEDDPEWGAQIGDLMTRGIPVLRSLIGLDFAVKGELRVEEAANSRLGDYAGMYNDATQTIDVRYDADGYTALHEAAHTWFNGTLFPDRWIGEAWAEYYGVEAGKQIGADGDIFTITPDLAAAKIPLNAWGGIASEPTNTEDYGYAASYALARLIAARATTAGLQSVWRAAAGHESAYQPVHPTSAEKGVPADTSGWQRLLDLLEERTGKSFDDLWREWVVTADQETQLDDRSSARAQYATTVTAAGDWELPYQVRYSLDAWQFQKAEDLMTDARDVLADRDRIATRAAALSLAVPRSLETAFEAGPAFDGARQIASDELTALTAIGAGTSTLAAPTSALEWAGLLFADPDAELAAARGAFEDGEATTATAAANDARRIREGAEDTGRLRVAVSGGALLILDGLAMAGLSVRGRRRRNRVARPAQPWAAPEPAARTAQDETRAHPPSGSL